MGLFLSHFCPIDDLTKNEVTKNEQLEEVKMPSQLLVSTRMRARE